MTLDESEAISSFRKHVSLVENKKNPIG